MLSFQILTNSLGLFSKNNEKNNDEKNKNINDPILCRDSLDVRDIKNKDENKNYRISSPRVPKR